MGGAQVVHPYLRLAVLSAEQLERRDTVPDPSRGADLLEVVGGTHLDPGQSAFTKCTSAAPSTGSPSERANSV